MHSIDEILKENYFLFLNFYKRNIKIYCFISLLFFWHIIILKFNIFIIIVDLSESLIAMEPWIAKNPNYLVNIYTRMHALIQRTHG